MNKQLSSSSWLFKLSLLSLSILAQTAPSISIAMPQLMATFPEQSQSSIELIATLPNMGVLLLILFAESIAKRFGIKRTILFGLSLYTIGGVLPAFVSNFYIILACRFLMGCGIGLFNPFSVSLMYRFYQGDELNDMLGYQNTSQNLGNAAFGFLLSALILFGWRVAFTGFTIGLIPFVLLGAFVMIPDDKPDLQPSKKEKPSLKDSVNGPILALALLFMVVFAMFLMLTIKMALFGEETGLFSASSASSILAGLGLSSMFAAPLFGKLSRLVGNYLLPISFTGIAIGFLLVANAQSIIMVITGVIIAGIFFGWVFPQAFLRVAQVAPKNGGTLTTSVVLMGINFGAAFSAVIINSIATTLGFTTTAGILVMCGIGFLILAGLEYLLTFLQSKKVS